MPRNMNLNTMAMVGLALLTTLILAQPVQADRAHIASVKIKNEQTGNRLSGRSTSKFVGSVFVRGNERVDVLWSPPSRGLKGGTTLLLEYRRQFGNKTSVMADKKTFSVTTPQESTFLIPPDDAGEDGPISAWRVRLVKDGKTLAEKASPTWR